MLRHPTRYYGHGDLHFLTFSCYRRQPFLGSARRRDLFLRALEVVRRQCRFLVSDTVVMPEHVHRLVSEPVRRDLSVVIKALKQAVARRGLAALRRRKNAQQGELHTQRRESDGAQTSKTGSSGAPPFTWPTRPVQR